MDLTQLEYFRIVAKLENITMAAKALYISQPTLSQSISRLEDNLGVQLFDRYKGKLHLNEAGKSFLAHVENAFAELNTGFMELENYKQTKQDWVYVASSVIGIFQSIILNYREICPEVHIDHLLAVDRSIMELLISGKVDFVITPGIIDDPHVNCVPLCTEEMFAVVGASHPLASRKWVTLEELRGYPLVCNSCDTDIHFMEQLFRTDYQELNIIASSSESHIPRDLTNAGHCVGFIPARIAARHLEARAVGAGPYPQNPLRISPACLRTNCISTKCTHTLAPHAEALYHYIVDFCAEENKRLEAYLQQYYGA